MEETAIYIPAVELLSESDVETPTGRHSASETPVVLGEPAATSALEPETGDEPVQELRS